MKIMVRRPFLTVALAIAFGISLTVFAFDFFQQNAMRAETWSETRWIAYNKAVDLDETSGVPDVFREVITILICRNAKFKQQPEVANVGHSAQLDVRIRNVGPQAIASMLQDLSAAFRGEPDTIDPTFEGTMEWKTMTPALADRFAEALTVLQAGAFEAPKSLDIAFLNERWQPNPDEAQTRTVADGFSQSWIWALSNVADEGTSAPELPVRVGFNYTVDGRPFEAQQVLMATIQTGHRFGDWIDSFFGRIQQLQLLLIGLLLPLLRFAPELWEKWRRPKPKEA